MNSFKIIIQGTKSDNGLATEYSSFYPDPLNTELQATIEDERDIPKKAGDKDAFSIQITKNYRVYSLIIGTSDVGGRPGFYGFRLYSPKNVILKNFEPILYQIKEKFFSYPSTKTQQSQSYEEILSVIDSDVHNTDFVFLEGSGNYVCYYDSTSFSLVSIFNSNRVYLTNKLYAFPSSTKGQSSISEFNSFDDLTYKLKETELRGELRLLTEIRINNQVVEFDNRQKSITILSYKDDRIDYKLHRDGIHRIDPLTSAGIIEHKSPPRTNPSPIHKSGVNTSSDRYTGVIVGCILSFAIGCAVCFLLFSESIFPFDFSRPESSLNYELVSTSQNHEVPSLDSITFLPIVKDGDTTFNGVQQQISHYTFKFEDNKWTYKNNNESVGYKDFKAADADNFEYQPVKFNLKDKQKLEEALQNLLEKVNLSNKKNQDKTEAKTTYQPNNRPANNKKTDTKKNIEKPVPKSKPVPDTKKKNGEVDVVPKF